MLFLAFRTSKDYAIEFSCLRRIRDFSDGISFFEFDVNLDLWHGDHNPKFEMSLTVFNFCLFEFNWYNVNHVEHEPFEACPSCKGTGEKNATIV
jgi:hypothetical protein